MKKFLVALCLALPLVAIADELGLNEPQWKDFAPKTFVDVQEPKGLGKFNVTAKYWYERRMAFEEGILECQAIEVYDERFTCYESLKVKQFKENTDYNARIEAQRQMNANIPEMSDRTDNMLQLNNYVNTYTRFMPNEIR
jgi:hypothetical protein